MYDTSELHPHIREIVESDPLFNSAPSQLLTVTNAKTIKGQSLGYLTAILYLSPADLLSVRLNLCPSAKLAGCIDGCLNTAGRGAFNSVQRARMRKTLYWWQYRDEFMALLVRDIERVQRMADRQGLKLAVRLNGTSDIRWEKQYIQIAPFNTNASDHRTIFDLFPNTQFYDYTKIPGRTVPSNYDLTFSSSTITARGALIYNDSVSDKAVLVLDFGSDKSSSSGDFTITFPTADASSAIIRIA